MNESTVDSPLALLLNKWVVELPAQQALEAKESPLQVGKQLVFRRNAHDAGTVIKSDNRRTRSETVIIGNGLDSTGSCHGDVARVVAKVDPHDGHGVEPMTYFGSEPGKCDKVSEASPWHALQHENRIGEPFYSGPAERWSSQPFLRHIASQNQQVLRIPCRGYVVRVIRSDFN